MLASLLMILCGCNPSTSPTQEPSPVHTGTGTSVPGLQASNAFYYYRDVDKAWAFYRDILGLETVVDYGFAKILRLAGSSYVTLVDAERGMHSADEPKTVTLSLVSEQVEAWYAYLKSKGVPIHSELRVEEGRPHDGFVAVDPEGYYLEFERFNPHPENQDLIPLLSRLEPLSGETGKRPPQLTVQATIYWLYYDDLARMQRFYEELLGVPLLVDQGWAKVYNVTGSGFLGLVDGSRGLHQATPKKGVTLSFFTATVEAWFNYARHVQGIEYRSQELGSESGRVTTFVAYDPEGYFLEWDTFLPVEGNEKLLEQLSR